MRKLKCSVASRNYSVLVGATLLSQAGKRIREVTDARTVLVVSNKRIAQLYYPSLRLALKAAGKKSILHLVPDSEQAKSEKELFKLYAVLLKHGFDRYSAMIALGGGVVGDLSAYCASTFMRGITFINIPTTLLAQVDSAIGGKTAINLPKGKNLIGTFYQPHLVISDVNTLRTLSHKQFVASLAEVIKYGIIWDAHFFTFLEKNMGNILSRDPKILERIISVSTKIKITVVEADETETSGLRAILNFGHTFAHGFEAAKQYRGISHGEAVALGMLVASYLAVKKDIMSKSHYHAIKELLRRAGLLKLIAKHSFDPKKVLHYMKYDKKKHGTVLKLVLPVRIGKVKIVDTVTTATLLSVLKELKTISK